MPRQPAQRRPRTGRMRGKPAAPRGAPVQGTLFEISAGGVIYRRTAAGIEICLIATKGGTRWQLPKGKREPGESLEQTAAREVAEETGLVGKIGPRLEKIDLWFTWSEGGTPVRHHKLVYFFLLEYERGETEDHDQEVHEARWFDSAEAMRRLTFPSERRVVSRALETLGVAAPAAPDTSRPARSPS